MIQDLRKLSTDSNLTELKRLVTQEQINAYAEASGDYNPLHIDPEFAAKTELGGTVAHGMLILAYLSEFMTENFGKNWINSGSLSARFKGAAYPGDTILVSGHVIGVEYEDGFVLVECDVLCSNQKEEPVITCITKLKGKSNEDIG
ncbi:MAG TPA: MaoC family dehydratase [Dehalococcoidia bacterium]|nr:MaoC family dehydratase [Dehalococcoidia bacterium]